MMTLLPSSRLKAALLCAALAAAAAAPASATRLRLDRAALDFDPNQNIWHVSSQLCNVDQNASGNINYHIFLYNDDPSARSGRSHLFDLGGVRFKNPLNPGECKNDADSRITVHYQKLRPGQYHIELVVGEWNGSKFAPIIHQPFMLENGLYQDFVKN